ncbi:MAG: hypothetical protein K1X85_11535 [Ignavibacteria bacterium]|nr:hypothetical protein [Ignavibacteria bacterium]
MIEGYTNFLWVMMMAGLSGAGADLLTSARVISISCGMLIIIAAYFISVRHFRLTGISSFAASFLIALNPGFVIWSYSGMETLFFSLLVLTGVMCLFRFEDTGKSAYAAMMSGAFMIASLTRPEGVMYFMISIVFLYAAERRNSVSHLQRLRNMVLPVLIFAVPYGIYFLWRWVHYGHFFPNTFYAKTGFENQQLTGLYYCYKFVRDSMAGGFLLVLPLYAAFHFRQNPKIRYLTVIILVHILYLVIIGGDILPVQRFFVPVIAYIFILTGIGLERLLSALQGLPLMKWLLIIVMAAYPVNVLMDSRSFPMLGLRRTLLYYDAMKMAGIWLKSNALPGETLAVESAGIMPYYSGMRSYDRLGLNDYYISRHGKYGKGERDKSDEEYVRRVLRPDYFVDAFPTLERQVKPDIVDDSVRYVYESRIIGRGTLEVRTGVEETGDIYFNYYRKSSTAKQ